MKIKPTTVSIRKLVQVVFFSLFIFIIWNTRYPINDKLNIKWYFQLDPLAMIITAIAERVLLSGLILTGITLVITILFGRVFCGWFCPLGAVLDFTALIKGKIMKLFKKNNHEAGPGKTLYFKYLILLPLLILAFAGYQAAWLFDPLSITFRAFSLNIHPYANSFLESFFGFLLIKSSFNENIEYLYEILRESMLSITKPEFPHSGATGLIFLLLILTVFIKRRFWCRYLCPLGAMLALFSRFSPFERHSICKNSCGICKNECRMNAIREDNSYKKEECILCFDCTENCPGQKTNFTFKIKRKENSRQLSDSKKQTTVFSVTRKSFIESFMLFFSLTLIPGSLVFADQKKKRKLRPPGALKEDEFNLRCIRCGNCIKICPTNGLKPAVENFYTLWTPLLDTEKGYCEFECNMCGKVCPTGAIQNLEPKTKKKFKIGLAVINKKTCLPWAKGEPCIVCEEHCPTSPKAIKLINKSLKGKKIQLPVINTALCTGCGICEYKCPVLEERGIWVSELKGNKKNARQKPG